MFQKNRRVIVFGCLISFSSIITTDQSGNASEHPADSSAAQSDDKASVPKETVRFWESIRNAGLPASPAAKNDPEKYWDGVYRIIFGKYRELAYSKNNSEIMKYIVCQFGKHGAEADMRLIWGSWEYACGPFRIRPLSPEVKGFPPDWRAVQLAVAEQEVRRFLKEPVILDRYYQAVLWHGGFFGVGALDRKADLSIPLNLSYPIRVGMTRRFFTRPWDKDENFRQEDYWWYARNFLILAHATGRDDLLKSADPEKLGSRFQQWRKFYEENGPFLRPSKTEPVWYLDEEKKKSGEESRRFLKRELLPLLKVVPQVPFHDWKGVRPPLAEDFRDAQ